jgi:hypothetical protein
MAILENLCCRSAHSRLSNAQAVQAFTCLFNIEHLSDPQLQIDTTNRKRTIKLVEFITFDKSLALSIPDLSQHNLSSTMICDSRLSGVLLRDDEERELFTKRYISPFQRIT